MLEARPKTFLSQDFALTDDGQPVGLLDISGWRERARIALEGREYALYRESWLGGDFMLDRDGRTIARARKPSVLRSAFEARIDDRTYRLEPISFWKRGFAVRRGAETIGTIEPTGTFTRRSLIDLPSELPLPFRVFLFWLALLMWNRQQAAS